MSLDCSNDRICLEEPRHGSRAGDADWEARDMSSDRRLEGLTCRRHEPFVCSRQARQETKVLRLRPMFWLSVRFLLSTVSYLESIVGHMQAGYTLTQPSTHTRPSRTLDETSPPLFPPPPPPRSACRYVTIRSHTLISFLGLPFAILLLPLCMYFFSV